LKMIRKWNAKFFFQECIHRWRKHPHALVVMLFADELFALNDNHFYIPACVLGFPFDGNGSSHPSRSSAEDDDPTAILKRSQPRPCA